MVLQQDRRAAFCCSGETRFASVSGAEFLTEQSMRFSWRATATRHEVSGVRSGAWQWSTDGGRRAAKLW
jgi:hypothetical protein